jgi:hypothetical protein
VAQGLVWVLAGSSIVLGVAQHRIDSLFQFTCSTRREKDFWMEQWLESECLNWRLVLKGGSWFCILSFGSYASLSLERAP